MVRGATLGDPGAMQRNSSRFSEWLRRIAGPKYPLPAALGRLVHCERCNSEFVAPVSWDGRGETDWWIRLRCGECGAVREVELSNQEAQCFVCELDMGRATIAATVARLEREHMIADTEALTAALRRDLIDPSDFRR
jgi:hypothetical protein